MNQTQVVTSRERMLQVVLKRQQLVACGTCLCSIAASMALALPFFWSCQEHIGDQRLSAPSVFQVEMLVFHFIDKPTPSVYDHYKLNND